MYLGEIVKQQLGTGAVVGHIPPFVKDNEGCLIEFFQQRSQGAGLFGFRKLVDQCSSAVEFNGNAFLTFLLQLFAGLSL
jgi:hypothetical protein